MEQNGHDTLLIDHAHTDRRLVAADPLLTVTEVTLLEEARRFIGERAASMLATAKTKQEQVAALEWACEDLMSLGDLNSDGIAPADNAELAALSVRLTALKEELRQTSTLYRWLERRGASNTLWLVLGGKSGAGKSALAGSITGVPGIVPSKSGRPVTAMNVRMTHDPTARRREATLALRDGTRLSPEGDAIDDHITLIDGQGRPLHRYHDIEDAEIRVAFGNPLGELFSLVDTAGQSEGQTGDEHRFRTAIERACDLMLIVDRPDDYRELVTPSNHFLYDFMASVPSFVVLNATPGNSENCTIRRKQLIEFGVPATRILQANCTSIKEVNDHVLSPILQWLVSSAR